MQRRPAALLAATLALGIGLTGCTVASEPDATPAGPSSAAPTPTPTAEVLLVAGGEQPPAVFGGDCAAALDAGVIAAAHGLESVTISPTDGSDNMGGIMCQWESGDDMGMVSIVSQRALGGADLSADEHRWRFEECDWGCEWLWESDELWISGYSPDLPEVGRTEADRRAGVIGASIDERHRALAEPPWDRDVSRWWPAMGCADLAEIVGARLGAPITADPAGYHDPPLALTAITDVASQLSWCTFSVEGVVFASAHLMPGHAWTVPDDEYSDPFAIDVPGVTGYKYAVPGYLWGTSFSLRTDVNELAVEVTESSPWSYEELVPLFAALAADDFR